MDVTHIHWIGHASFRIEDGAAQIYIDPWKVPAGSPPADVILITHGHYDHFSPDDIACVEGPGTVFVAPADVAAKLPGRTVVAAKAGEPCRAGSIGIEPIPAYNVGKSSTARTRAGSATTSRCHRGSASTMRATRT